jgi:hypothetical protein
MWHPWAPRSTRPFTSQTDPLPLLERGQATRRGAEVVELGLQPQILGGGRSGGQPFQPSAKPGDASEVAPSVAGVSLQHASSALLAREEAFQGLEEGH